ncbi:MAG: helix-turn-helix transcriptional regulator [Oscillospiraceae bacterium]|nr:helix-turn-helix transcriptional regulator [Oscillospiraceae bacterium]
MKERIKSIRKSLGLTQEQFSDKLNLSRNYIAQLEIGTKVPSDRTISDMCREYNINEQWLRTGEGEMYDLPEDRTAAIVADLLDKQCPTYNLIINIIDKYRKLDPVSQSVIDKFLDDLLKGED